MMRNFVILAILFCGSKSYANELQHGLEFNQNALIIEMDQYGGANPGVDVRLSEKALNYACTEAVKHLSDRVRDDLHIPDQHGKAHTPVGHVDYSFTNIHVVGYDPPATSIKLSPGSVITWNVNDLYVKIEAKWKYKYKKIIKISDHGRVSIKARVNLNIAFTVGADAKGYPVLSCTTCTVYVHGVDVKFHGGASWLYNLFSKTVESTLKKQLNSQLTSLATNFINKQGNAQLAKLNLTTTIDKKYELDYSLVKDPMTTDTYLQTFHKGEVFLKGSRTEAPFSPAPLPDIDSQKMMTFYASEYVVNTLTYSMYKNNQFNYVISKETVPSNYSEFLKTSDCSLACFGTLVPQLRKQYPNRYVMMDLKPNKAPQVTIKSSGMILQLEGAVVVSIEPETDKDKPIYAFTASISASGVLKPVVSASRVHWSIDNVKNKMHVTDSAIGSVTEWAMDLLFKVGFGLLGADINVQGKEGIELPTQDNITLVTPELKLFDGGLLVASDVKYNPK